MLPVELSRFYSSLADYFERARSDLMWSLNDFMKNTQESNIKRIYDSSQKGGRVKSEESVLRKCNRHGIVSPESIPEAIEDLIGLRIVTPNKTEAREMFEFLRTSKDKWFCDLLGEPRFTPMTIADRNRHSISTGYQAYHITFTYDRSYHPGTSVNRWPVEIQITSQLWEFWANYSHKYFYSKVLGPSVQKLLPYVVAIAKALDNAEDLMATTSELLITEAETARLNEGKKNE